MTLNYGHALARLAAALIDLLIIATLAACTLFYPGFPQHMEMPSIPWPAIAVCGYFAFAVVIGGLTAFAGGTPGQKLMGLEVVALATGKSCGLIRSVLRALLIVLSWLPFGVGVFRILFAPDRAAYHDLFTNSRIVGEDESKVSLFALATRT